MSQIQDYKLKLSLIKIIQTYQEAIDDLSATVESLPRCPCCPPNVEDCLISFLNKDVANAKKFSKMVKISEDKILMAMNGEYTLSQDEAQKIASWIFKKTKI